MIIYIGTETVEGIKNLDKHGQMKVIPAPRTAMPGEVPPRRHTPIAGTTAGIRAGLLNLANSQALPEPQRTIPKQKRIFFLSGERIKCVALSARRNIPHPRNSRSAYAFGKEDLTEDYVKPDIATARRWNNFLAAKKPIKGDVVILN